MVMSAPAVEPTTDVLQRSWAWRSLAWKHGNVEQIFQWRDAWDILLDALLEKRPELRDG